MTMDCGPRMGLLDKNLHHRLTKLPGLMPRRNRRDLRLNSSIGPVRIDLETTADAVGENSEQVHDRNEDQTRQHR